MMKTMPTLAPSLTLSRSNSKINTMADCTLDLYCRCGTLKRVVWYFDLKSVVWYFEEGVVLLWRGWYCTLKRVVWYFEESGMVD